MSSAWLPSIVPERKGNIKEDSQPHLALFLQPLPVSGNALKKRDWFILKDEFE